MVSINLTTEVILINEQDIDWVRATQVNGKWQIAILFTNGQEKVIYNLSHEQMTTIMESL